MDAALVLVMPVGFIELHVNTTVIDFPTLVKPARALEFFFNMAKNVF
jgi:hypothetical protein